MGKNMLPYKKFRIGSSVFFDSYPDYVLKDTDWVCLTENYLWGDKSMRVKIGADDIMLYRKDFSKEDFIKDALNDDLSLKVGKFLVPEFIDYFGVTINDLKLLKPLIDGLDEKHVYEKIIYDAYIAQGTLELKSETIDLAYEEYKKFRK